MRMRIIVGLVALLQAALGTSAVSAEAQITPYLEVQQVLDAEFNNGGDVLTYTTLAAGVDGSVSTKRVEAQVSYRYEHRIPWDNSLSDESVHSGLARARADIVRNLLSVEGGMIAMQARSDIRGAAPAFFSGNDDNVTQVYGVYAGPNLTARAGPLLVKGSYRLGYVKVDDDFSVTLPGGQVALDRYDHATSHDASLSVGMEPGALPFGWMVTGGYTREKASQLDQRYVGKYVRGDVTLPVSPHLALTGGAGYEDIRVDERAPLRDANGQPVIDSRNRFITDPASPRLLSYETDGLIWDVGAIWKPNRRVSVEVRGGRRYGGRAITGTIEYQMRRNVALRAGVYDGIESFGRALTRGLVRLPTSFVVDRNPLTGDFGGCVFGTTPGTGGCFDDALQSITTANYRSRGGYLVLSGERGPWQFGMGGGYANHKYLAPQVSQLFTIDGIVDKSVSLEAQATRDLSSVSSLSGNINYNWYSSGLSGAPNVTNIGVTTSYTRYLTDRLLGFGSLGVYNYRIERVGRSTHGQAVIGLRYQLGR
ncbi:MAG: hypothetical protein AB7G25_09815 [Sphingomonadaceae bacterium]